MTDLIGRRKRRNRKNRSSYYGEDYQIISERNRDSNKEKYVPIIDRHIDGA